MVRDVLGASWWEALLLAAGRWVLDYLTLLAALTAVRRQPAPSRCCSRSAPRSCSARCRSRRAGSGSSRRD